ncbi:MAG: hypothetical protein ACOC16_02850 [Nanoarchaeota archaeon]
MKKNQYLYIASLLIVLTVVGYIIFFNNNNTDNLTESEAISILKNTYLEFGNYPNDNLPPQSISTEKDPNGWYVAFVQEGSGRPILGAKCFFVKNDKTIRILGEFNPEIGDNDYSIKTCN